MDIEKYDSVIKTPDKWKKIHRLSVGIFVSLIFEIIKKFENS